MTDLNSSIPGELPSRRKLIRSTVLAAVVASTLLVTVVLPAEYGVDPTGSGRMLGLTEMGEIKVSLAKEALLASLPDAPASSSEVAVAPPTAAPVSPARVVTATEPEMTASEPEATNSHETRVRLAPGEGKEIKLVMREGARVKYSWSTDRGVVNYDMHADSVNPTRDYHSYAKGTGVASDAGELVAAFDGSHGWFWRNRTKEEATVTLTTAGEYTELKELK